MIRIIVSVALLVLLAVFVSLNFGYTTPINLFGVRIINSIPVVAVSALSFAFGIVYSLFLYTSSYLRSKKKRELATKGRNMKIWEKKLDSREADKKVNTAGTASAFDLQKRNATAGSK
jgi:uncharacterized integral membrane protein